LIIDDAADVFDAAIIADAARAAFSSIVTIFRLC